MIRPESFLWCVESNGHRAYDERRKSNERIETDDHFLATSAIAKTHVSLSLKERKRSFEQYEVLRISAMG